MEITNLEAHLEHVSVLLGPDRLRRVLQDTIAPEFIEAWYRRFSTQSNADGSPWSSDLIDTGELEGSVRVEVLGESVAAGPEGDRNIRIAEEQAARGNVVGGFDDILLEQIAQAIDEWMGSAFEERG